MFNLTEDRNEWTLGETFCRHGISRIDQKIFFSLLNAPLSFTAFLGNALVIHALYKVTSLHSPYKLLLTCLASTDLCVGLVSQPLFVVLLWTPEHSTRCFVLKLINHIIGTMFGGVSLATLSAISIERLVALLLGIRYRQVVTFRRARICVATFWLAGVVVSILYLHSFVLPLVTTAILLLLFIVSSTFCYLKIYCNFRHQETKVQVRCRQGQLNRREAPPNVARYRKTVSSALWLQIAVLLCYLPFGMIAVVYAISGIQTQALNVAWALTVSLVFFNSTLNPFLYCWRTREVRKEVKDTIKQLCCFLS